MEPCHTGPEAAQHTEGLGPAGAAWAWLLGAPSVLCADLTPCLVHTASTQARLGSGPSSDRLGGHQDGLEEAGGQGLSWGLSHMGTQALVTREHRTLGFDVYFKGSGLKYF